MSVGERQNVVAWLRQLAEHSQGESLLCVDRLSAADALLSPLYLGALHASQGKSESADDDSQSGLSRVRSLARHCRNRIAGWNSGRVRPTDVLFWPREITHVAVLSPIERALRSAGVSCRTLACERKCFADARAAAPDAVFAPAVWPRELRAARAAGRRRVDQLREIPEWNLPLPNHPQAGALASAARRTILKHLPEVFEAARNARLALERFNPRILVVGNDLTLEGRTACRVAAQLGVPTLAFMHGSLANNELHSCHIANRFVLHGEVNRIDLVGRGVPAEQLVVCGSPHLDNKPTQSGELNPELARVLGLRPNQPWILVATSGPGNATSHRHHATIIQNLRRLSDTLGDVPLVVKLHRKDRLEHYGPLLAGADPSRVFVISKADRRLPYDVFQWLQGCRLVLTTTSTVAVEAMLMQVPVVTMDFCGEAKNIDFIDAGATTHVRTSDELLSAVRGILDKGPGEAAERAARQYVEQAYYRVDGRAAERCAAEICRLGGISWPGEIAAPLAEAAPD